LVHGHPLLSPGARSPSELPTLPDSSDGYLQDAGIHNAEVKGSGCSTGTTTPTLMAVSASNARFRLSADFLPSRRNRVRANANENG